jgi:archaellum biogenesis ATPase FlaH
MLEAIAAIQKRCLEYAKSDNLNKDTDNEITQPPTDIKSKSKMQNSTTVSVLSNPKYQERILTLDKINTTESNIDWLIQGMLATGSSMLLSGLSGSGKSPLLTKLAQCFVTGEEFLGHTTKKSKVLYVYGDELEAEGNFKERLKTLGLTDHLTKDFFAVSYIGIEELDAWEYFVTEYKPDVVILDSLTYAYLNVDSNENQAEWIKPVERVKQLLHTHGATLIAVHHDNKNSKASYNNRVAGTSRLVSRFSTVLRLETFENVSITNTGRRLSGKVKSGSNIDIKIDCDFENCQFTDAGDYETSQEATSNQTMKQRILKILSTNNSGLTGVEIKELLHLVDDSEYRAMNKALTRLRDSKAITCKVNPKNLTQKIYTLPNPTHTQVSTNQNPIYTQMSTISTQSHTESDFQLLDNTVDIEKIVDKVVDSRQDTTIDTETIDKVDSGEVDNRQNTISDTVSTEVSTIQNPYPESVRDSIVDKVEGIGVEGVSTVSTIAKASPRPISVGDRVVIHNEGSKHDKKIGKVLSLYTETNDDQSVELANVKLSDGGEIQAQIVWLKRRPILT